MRLLLDTHILLWWATADRTLKKAIREITFDGILIAQAIVEGRRLITSDDAILGYAGISGFNPLPA